MRKYSISAIVCVFVFPLPHFNSLLSSLRVYNDGADNNKLSIESIQNATLAGGVAVGGSSDLVIGPGGAILLGAIAGTISTVGFAKLSDILKRTIGLDDSCGVHNLHGMPGVLGAIAGIISCAVVSDSMYGESIGAVFPFRAPSNETLAALEGILKKKLRG